MASKLRELSVSKCTADSLHIKLWIVLVTHRLSAAPQQCHCGAQPPSNRRIFPLLRRGRSARSVERVSFRLVCGQMVVRNGFRSEGVRCMETLGPLITGLQSLDRGREAVVAIGELVPLSDLMLWTGTYFEIVAHETLSIVWCNDLSENEKHSWRLGGRLI